MSRDLNQVTLIGNLVRDPEIKYLATGTPVCNFSIANNQDYSKDGNVTKQAYYFDIEVWNKQAENCNKFLSKGSKVCVSGLLVQDRWIDKETQNTRSKIKIKANSVEFLSLNQQTGDNGGNVGQQQKPEIIEDPWGKKEDPSNLSPKEQDALPDQPAFNDDVIPF
jgi:single-strand DNA-binding protein